MQIFLQLFFKKVIDSPKTAKLKGLGSQNFSKTPCISTYK